MNPKEIKTKPLSDAEIADKLRGLAQNPLGIDSDEDFRISLAGVQEKTALLKLDGRWHLPLSTTPTTHILKPQIGKVADRIDLSKSVENEFLCLRLVSAFGIPVNEAEIEDFEDKRVLIVKRFDRLWTNDNRLLRIPQEDFCQALSIAPSRKYESDGGPSIKDIALFLKRSDRPELDLSIFFKAQIAFWLLGATDGHAKNFSIHLASGGSFSLAPLYDIVSAQPNFDANQMRKREMKLAMAVGNSRHYRLEEINRQHFIQTGAVAEIPENVVKRSIEQFLDEGTAVIDQTINSLPAEFPSEIAESISKSAKERLGTMSRT